MNLEFHLYSAHANCRHCMHLFHKMDQSTSDPGHCSIIGSDVEDDYYCSFYRMKPEKPIERTDVPQPGPSNTGNNTEDNRPDNRKPKKL